MPSCYGRSAFVFGGMDSSEYTDRSGGVRVIPVSHGDASGGLECKWYNYDCFKGDHPKCSKDPDHPSCRCNEVKHYCEQPEEGKRSHCYMSWTNKTGTPELIKAGCWLNDLSCWDKNECISTKKLSNDVHFCCCEGNMCNQDFQPPIMVEQDTPSPATVESTPVPPPSSHAAIGYALIIPVVGLFFVAIAYAIYRRQKSLDSRHLPVPTDGDDGDDEDRSLGSPHLGRLRPIQLLEIKVCLRSLFNKDEPRPVML